MNYTIVPSYAPISSLEKVKNEFKNILTYKPVEILVSAVALYILAELRGVESHLNMSLAFLSFSIISLTAYRWSHVLKFIKALTIHERLEINDMSQHMYQECTLQDSGKRTVATLKYRDHTPVLKLYTSDSYEMGYAQGYILADKISELFEDVLLPMMNFGRVLKGDFNREHFKKQSKEISIPEDYLIEIYGLFDGMQEAFRLQNKKLHMTEADIINAHKLPDIYKAVGCQKLFGQEGHSAIGCTTVAVRQADGSVVIGRTLDWPAFIKGGRHILQRIYTTKTGMKVQLQTFPGIIHALTASNSAGLVAIINELGTTCCHGIPYGMRAREIIENATTINEGRQMIHERLRQDNFLGPASSHHLTLATQSEVCNFQFYPLPEIKLLERELGNGHAHLIVTNHGVDLKESAIQGSEADSTSHRRWEAVEKVLKGESERYLPLRKSDDIEKKYGVNTVIRCLQSANVLDTIAATVYQFDAKFLMPTRIDVHGGSFAASNLKSTDRETGT